MPSDETRFNHVGVCVTDIQRSRSFYENALAGKRCSAEVADSYHTTVELFLVFAAPVSTRGQKKTMGGMADHVYDQLQRDCGFGGVDEVGAERETKAKGPP